MLDFLLTCGTTLLILPLVIFWHELGHAAVALLKRQGEVTITVGQLQSERLFSFRWGQLTIHIQRLFFWAGLCQFPPQNERDRAWSLAGGPLASALLWAFCLGMSYWAAAQPRSLWQPFWGSLTIMSALQFLVTALPMRYPHWVVGGECFKSDGKQLLELLRKTKSSAR